MTSIRPSFPLRIVAILMALGDIGHTSGVLRTIPRSMQEGGLLGPMQAFPVTMMGTTRTHWDFYVGFGLSVSFQFLLVAGLAWMAGTLADAEPARARPFIYLLLVAQLAGLVIGVVYFFLAPIAMTVLTLVCLLWALALTRRSAAAGNGAHQPAIG